MEVICRVLFYSIVIIFLFPPSHYLALWLLVLALPYPVMNKWNLGSYSVILLNPRYWISSSFRLGNWWIKFLLGEIFYFISFLFYELVYHTFYSRIGFQMEKMPCVFTECRRNGMQAGLFLNHI